MGTIRFQLRKDQPYKDGSCPIRLIYQVKGERRYFVPNKKIFDVNWNEKQQKAVYISRPDFKRLKLKIDYDQLLSSDQVLKFNDSLSTLRNEISGIETRFQLDNKPYSSQTVIDYLRAKREPETKKEAPMDEVYNFIDRYISDNAASREPGSMSVYKSLKNHLQNYQAAKKVKISFAGIDRAFFLDFQNFLITSKSKRAPDGLGNVTIAKQLSTLKTFLNYARMNGMEVSDKYKDFKIKKESLEVIALTSDEFEILYNYDLSKNNRLAQVRDVFCFSCATGLRYSDLAQLKREHIKRDEIRLTITKTKQHLAIPLNPFSYAILNKYAEMHRPLPVISNQKMNEYIKELCKLADIDEPVQIVRFRGNKREENIYPKHELISVHTGRKTFCTLSLEKGMSAEEVMQISGHKNYASFSRYVKITEKRTKIVMSKAWGDIPKSNLKAV